MNNQEQLQFKQEKFTDNLIIEFFKILNNNHNLTQYLAFGHKFSPVRLKDFKQPAFVLKKVLTTNFNVYTCVDAGHVYDDYSVGHSKTNEERSLLAQKKITKLVNELQRFLKMSKNPKFNSLKVDNVTKEYPLVLTKRDSSDEGDDYFGVELFLKIHW